MSAPGVSLWEVVEARGGPLSESETWAVLAAAATSLQDTALSGKVPLGSGRPARASAELLLLLLRTALLWPFEGASCPLGEGVSYSLAFLFDLF